MDFILSLASTDKSWYETGLLGWYIEGGRFMIALFLCQVMALAVIIERYGAYRAIRIDAEAFRESVKKLLGLGQVDDAVKLCDDTPGPVAASLAVGLRRFKLLKALGKPADQLESEVTKAIDGYGSHMLAVLEKHLPILATVVALAPLFGFLGTVDGMVYSFRDIEEAARSGGGQSIVVTAAAGIKIALYTTLLGLCIGIVAQLFYNIFSARVNRIVLEVEQSATDLIQSLALMTALGKEVIGEEEVVVEQRT